MSLPHLRTEGAIDSSTLCADGFNVKSMLFLPFGVISGDAHPRTAAIKQRLPSILRLPMSDTAYQPHHINTVTFTLF
jgi:hypothetical protein